MGIERSAFLIDGDGIIHALWRKVRVVVHVDEVKQTAETLDALRKCALRVWNQKTKISRFITAPLDRVSRRH